MNLTKIVVTILLGLVVVMFLIGVTPVLDDAITAGVGTGLSIDDPILNVMFPLIPWLLPAAAIVGVILGAVHMLRRR